MTSPSGHAISTVLVVGSGTMGRGIASVTAIRGFETLLFDADPRSLASAPDRIGASWEKAVSRGRLSAEEVAPARRRLHRLSRLADAREADVAIEAVPESLDLKRSIFAELDSICGPGALLASNTSSLSIAKIAAATRLPKRVIGLHFFNPVPAKALVEIVVGRDTSAEIVERARAFVEVLGKEPIIVKDSPGFATSRLGVALGLEAVRMLEEGVASAADIDRAMEAGYGHAMGPLKTSDLVGLDVRLSIANSLAEELSEERFRPPELLRRLVAQGKTGRKAGEGFYRWEGEEARSVEPETPGKRR
ncbi:MAG: 3-hydroxyacyl-CoA dehydrogenase family protein [Thermoanaerobaculia bacterium]